MQQMSRSNSFNRFGRSFPHIFRYKPVSGCGILEPVVCNRRVCLNLAPQAAQALHQIPDHS